MKIYVVILSFLYSVLCRDFYVGMFKKDDLLVASDTLFKERVPYRLAYAKYGRLFKCEITYFRVVDRLGVGRMPTVKIIRGGLRKKYVVLRLASAYNLPLSVNIYVGCENKYNFTRSTYIIRPTTENSTVAVKAENGTTVASSDKPAGDGAGAAGDAKNGTEPNNEENKEGGENAETPDPNNPGEETTTGAAARNNEHLEEIVAEAKIR